MYHPYAIDFLDLPPEVACIIYSYYFASQLVTITTTGDHSLCVTPESVKITGWNDVVHPLLVCKQIYYSASPHNSKATVRVEMSCHFYAELVSGQQAPCVNQKLVPAVKHVWKCMNTLAPPKEISEAGSPSCLSNFQSCIYNLFGKVVRREFLPEYADSAAYFQEVTMDGKYDESTIRMSAASAFLSLNALQVGMLEVVFSEVFIACDLQATHKISLFKGCTRTKVVSRINGHILSIC